MNPLQARKQALIAESEINRTQLAGDLTALTAGVHALTKRAQSIGSIASSVTLLMAGLAAFRCGKAADTGAKPPWLQTILKGAGLISTVWLAFCPPGRGQKDR